MRAKVPGVDVRAVLGEHRCHGPIHRVVRVDAVHAATNAGLVGDHHDRVAPPVDGGNGLGHARNHDQFLGVAQILALLVDHAVAIEQ